MNKMKSKLYFFFSLIGTLLLSACGVRNHHGFVGEDARFANYTFLGTDGDGSTGLAYYADETNPNEIAVAIGTCEAEDIIVTTYDDKPVTSIFPSGFQNCDTIHTITLPDSVTTFGTDAFAGSSLQSIALPRNLTVVSSGSFRNCKSLTTVRFKNGNLINTINDYAFANCYNLATFPFHEMGNLTTIGKEAFLYCLGLTSVVFPENFSSLGSYAFQDCKNLTTIYFPASTAYVAANAFRGVGESARIYFSEEEPGTGGSSSSASASSSRTPVSLAEDFNFSYDNYYIPITFGVGAMKFDDDYPYFQFITPEDGIYEMKLCSTGKEEGNWSASEDNEYTDNIAKDEVILINYTGSGGAINIPSTILSGAYKVVGIMKDVFMNKNVTSVIFHENLRFIDYRAFADNTGLTSIDLSGAVDLQHIQSRAFFNTMNSNGANNSEFYSIHIPSNVINIGPDAFRSCDGLFRLYFDGATSEYEESFICPATGNFSFNLTYQPLNVTSVTFDGPSLTLAQSVSSGHYTLAGKTITLPGRKSGVAKVKYTTNSTTTQTFTGYKDDNNALVSEFVLATKTDAGSIGSVTVGGVAIAPAAYAISDYDSSKSKITFASAPAENAAIVVTYRGQSKLQKIDPYAFYGCAPSFGSKKPYGSALSQIENPFSNIYFPASLTTIGSYAFGSGQFIGGVIFKSTSLSINEYAFSEQKSLSSIVFPNQMSSLSLYTKCFASGLSIVQCAAGCNFKKLISVTLPSSTTLRGNEIFSGHIFVAIYCIGNKPANYGSYTTWNKVCDKGITTFGSFSSAGAKVADELDFAPVYEVDSVSDIITLPDTNHPVFDFVKEKGNNSSVTFANYHYHGGRIQDANGNPAIIAGSNLTSNSTALINSNYSSEYAVLLPNGHFRLVIPYKVAVGNAFFDVTTIGKQSLAIQINGEKMHPKGDGPKTGTTKPNEDSTKYWKETENLWTMRELYLPDSIETIGNVAIAVVPFTTVRSYANDALDDSQDGLAKIWDSSGTISAVGKFPSSLRTVGEKAFVFSAITNAKFPDCLEVFGTVGASGPDLGTAYYDFPFMGCFDLAELSMYVADEEHPVQDPTFAASGGVIIHRSTNRMVEGAEAKTDITIPWGTQTMTAGALRGGRKIQNVLFPYTLTAISNNLLDTIGDSRDSSGRSGLSDLTSVAFGDISQYDGEVADANTPYVPLCTSIGKSAFYGCGSLTSVEFPVGLQSLGETSFINCTSLNTIKINKGTTGGVTNLGSHLNFTELPSLNTINKQCFESCTAITQITTSSSLTALGESIFIKCSGLTALNLNSATTSLGNSCFNGCTNLPSVTFTAPGGNTLGSSCFSGCSKLTSITFNGTTNSIGTSCFYNCSKLETITFTADQTNTTFQNNAFENCTSLKSITIPNGVTVKNNVFKGCTGLNDNLATGGGVIVKSGVKFTGDKTNSAFIGCEDTTRIYLEDNETQYQANSSRYPTGWNCYAYSGDSGSALPFYCYSATQPETTSSNWGYWHYNNGVPEVWPEA